LTRAYVPAGLRQERAQGRELITMCFILAQLAIQSRKRRIVGARLRANMAAAVLGIMRELSNARKNRANDLLTQ
jgi:hypothetical protein